MARYILCATSFATFPNCPSGRKKGVGQSLADTIGNALPGDLVVPGLTASPSPVNLRPLDAAAATVMGLPIVTLQQIVTNNPCNSGGAGADAGN
jgi:hypothetical protein